MEINETLNHTYYFSRCSGCEVVLQGIESQISKANQYKETQTKLKQQVETDVSTY